MVRLNPKDKPPIKGKYPNIDEIDFLINNDLPLNNENGRKQFSKKNNGEEVK
jgi:hypothetical protein